MIALTEQQREALKEHAGQPLRLTDPQTSETFVLVRADMFDRMTNLLYDDSEWTAEERDALAWEAGKAAGWDEMDEYDNYEKPQ